ncbi:MAG: glutamine-hydrolyzing GMP synthase [Oligoflexia bacterium]|nr:glutamine-hydrolyzing GMP synthase [Oligoflexia bacterium]
MDRIIILDFGSQFTQLIARRVREVGVYTEILPANAPFHEIKAHNPKGIILSGGPHSVFDSQAPQCDRAVLNLGVPLLGVCYGMQWLAQNLGGKVSPAKVREYGLTPIQILESSSPLFAQVKKSPLNTWMSHGDEVDQLPDGFKIVAKSESGSLASMENRSKNIYALQFHPEVSHTEEGAKLLNAFIEICNPKKEWNLKNFAQEKISEIQKQVGTTAHAICALSGGVDSTVAATLVEKAIPGRLHCLYIDSGLQRKNESQEVMKSFENSGLKVSLIDAQKDFLTALSGLTDPEQKRKAIGKTFIEIFQREEKRLAKEVGEKTLDWLVQGTLYPDVIESMPPPGRGGFSATIKSHHNVGGLPENMKLSLIEPLRELFKDEVRKLGKELGVSSEILGRHPFPGPGLAVRCLGEVTKEKLDILREADSIYISEIRAAKLYDQIWQAGTILIPISTVGVMGDGRTYEYPVALRAVVSQDGMTADWFRFPHEVLAKISNRIVNEVRGVNRVVYDISTKPPATIEWE